jgi:hypothetical protein
MTDAVGMATSRTHRAVRSDIPIFITQWLNEDPHGAFRRYRATHPVVAHESGAYNVLRFADVDWLGNDPPRARKRNSLSEDAWHN